MKIPLTASLVRNNSEVFLAILLPPQMIVTERETLPSYARFLSILLQLPVVLVGQGTGDFWQSFGEQRFAAQLNQINLAKLAWQQIEIDLK
jgi:hypothetical protein